MKILAAFISLLIFISNGIPCCVDDCTEDIAAEQQEKNSHSNELCSPFLSCGTCSALVFQEEPSEILFSVPAMAEEDSEAEIGIISDFTFRIWQPPKNS